jgi:hypothetical protein
VAYCDIFISVTNAKYTLESRGLPKRNSTRLLSIGLRAFLQRSQMPSKVATLLAWSKSQGIEIDDRVVLEETPHSGIAIVAGDALIPCDAIRELPIVIGLGRLY